MPVLQERRNVRNARYPDSNLSLLAFLIVIYMERLGYLERVGLNR